VCVCVRGDRKQKNFPLRVRASVRGGPCARGGATLQHEGGRGGTAAGCRRNFFFSSSRWVRWILTYPLRHNPPSLLHSSSPPRPPPLQRSSIPAAARLEETERRRRRRRKEIQMKRGGRCFSPKNPGRVSLYFGFFSPVQLQLPAPLPPPPHPQLLCSKLSPGAVDIGPRLSSRAAAAPGSVFSPLSLGWGGGGGEFFPPQKNKKQQKQKKEPGWKKCISNSPLQRTRETLMARAVPLVSHGTRACQK